MCEALDATSKAEAGKTGDFVLGAPGAFMRPVGDSA